VFDVGSNIGDKASVFAGLSERVLCIEADPSTAAKLSLRFAFEEKVSVEAVAVGSEYGVARLFRKQHSGFNTLSEKWSDASEVMGVAQVGTVSVPMTTLDQLIAVHGVPDYIKIDVEGFELPALRGLSASVRAISFEANLPTFIDETEAILERLVGLQPATHFNLRIMEATHFHLPRSVDSKLLISTLHGLSPFTCDVFAVNSPF